MRRQLLSWCLDVIKRTFYWCEVNADVVSVIRNFENVIFAKDTGRDFKVSAVYLFLAQMLLMDTASLNYETLLKSIFLATRGAQAKPLAAQGNIAYVWGSHFYAGRPGADRRLWLSKAFRDAKILTVVRLPEKTIDSLFLLYINKNFPGNLPFDNIAGSSAAAGFPAEAETSDCFRCIRFEDLHEETGMVIAAWCKWMGIEYSDDILDNSFSLESSSGSNNQGTRRLKTEDLTPYCFSFADILKLRHLFQEEYRAWGYADRISPSLDDSLALYERLDRIAALPFAAQGMFDLHETADPSIDVAYQKERHKRLLAYFHDERKRRDEKGFTPIPLLYSPCGKRKILESAMKEGGHAR